MNYPKIIIIVGHYGCGKTNISVNLAMHFAEKGEKVTVVDLDIVNPYFRTADFKQLFSENNIQLKTPTYANSNLDIPALNYDMGALTNAEGRVIIDVGGDPEGAAALGRYSDALKSRDDVGMYCVVNRFRYLTSTAAEATELMHEIAAVSGISFSGIINNSNLGALTTPDTVRESVAFAEEIARAERLPLLLNASEPQNLVGINNAFPVKIYVKPIWEV